MRKVILLASLMIPTLLVIAQDQTINAVLTVNNSSSNTLRIEDNTAGQEALLRFRSKPSNNIGWMHSDIGVYSTSSTYNEGFLGFKVPANNNPGQGYKMVVNSEGYVGIGTTTPSNKLDVAGTIRAEEVKVETGWADYVFFEDYDLKSLDEVSNFISENGHLPNIPTAKEVKQNGIKLGEMNAKLLEKIEELTLYLIEQNQNILVQSERLEALRIENREQSKLIQELINR